MFICAILLSASTLPFVISSRSNSVSKAAPVAAASILLAEFVLLCAVSTSVNARPMGSHVVRQVPPAQLPPPSAAVKGNLPANAAALAGHQSSSDVDLSSLGLLGPPPAVPAGVLPGVPVPVDGSNLPSGAQPLVADATGVQLTTNSTNSQSVGSDSSMAVIIGISIALLLVIIGIIIGVVVARKKRERSKTIHGASSHKSSSSKHASSVGHSKGSKVNDLRRHKHDGSSVEEKVGRRVTKSGVTLSPSEKDFERAYGHRRWKSEREREGALKAFKMVHSSRASSNATSAAAADHRSHKAVGHGAEHHETTSLLTKSSHQ